MKFNQDMVFSFPMDQLATLIAEKLQPYFLSQIIEQPKEEGYRTRKETYMGSKLIIMKMEI